MDLRITHIIEDTRQKDDGSHDNIRQYMEAEGIKLIRSKLLCGDYALPTLQNICIDTKQNMLEVYNNIVGDREDRNRSKGESPRFHRECQLAHEVGIHLVILIEDPDVKCLDEVKDWQNPRSDDFDFIKAGRAHGWFSGKEYQSKPPMASESLQKAMKTMSDRYGVEWIFCRPAQTGAYIEAILTKGIAQNKIAGFNEIFDLTQK